MNTIYCLSGLGADRRAFQFLDLPDYEMIFIDWIPPLKEESMQGYALRLSGQIKEENAILIGLSFGGMMAIELSKIVHPSKVILISSAKNREELNPKYSFVIQWNLMKLIPRALLKKSNFIAEYIFGVHTKRDRNILAEILADTDLEFLFWALGAMVKWDNHYHPKQLLELHGTADKIIPYRMLPTENSVEGGGHLMVLDKAAVISERILSYLRN
jgi:pimeloyl-ACP methyl ester carboxylesterase